MAIDDAPEVIRVAFIPTEREWLIKLRESTRTWPMLTFGPASLDVQVLEQAEIVVFDATAPQALMQWLETSGAIGIQLGEPGDQVSPVAYFYLPSTIDIESLKDRVLTAYTSRCHALRSVGLVGATGGSGVTEMAVGLGWQQARAGFGTLLVDASTAPGEMALRLGVEQDHSVINRAVRVRKEESLWLYTLGLHNRKPDNLPGQLPHIPVRRLVVDMGTLPIPSVIERLDDLVIVTRPTPGGLRRARMWGHYYRGATIAINGQVSGPAQLAAGLLTRELPGQVHYFPDVTNVIERAWYAQELDHAKWQQSITTLLPPLPSLITDAA